MFSDRSMKILKDIIDNGVELTLKKPDVTFSGAQEIIDRESPSIVVEIGGFYKSNNIWLYEYNGELKCISRYGDYEGGVHSFIDLVFINYKWWKNSADKFEGWGNPSEFWEKHFLRLELVKVEILEKKVVRALR